MAEGTGYDHEIGDFLNCIKENTQPDRVSLTSAARSLKIIEAEERSARTGQIVRVN